jgi:hypothetical protein
LHGRSSPFRFPSARSTRCISRPSKVLRGRGQTVELASYEERMVVAARALGIALAEL